MDVQFHDMPDTFVLKLTTSVEFTVKSMYEDLMNDHATYLRKDMWKLKLPLKIKVFMWFLNNKVLLIKDNLAKLRWKGCTKCSFCGLEVMVKHLTITCTFTKFV